MSTLWRKLLRDILRMKGQCVAIAVLIALAVGTFVGFASTHRSLSSSRDAYYSEYRFGHVFAEVARAPRTLAEGLRAIDGVESLELRLASPGLLSLPAFDEPVSARLVGLPAVGEPELGLLHLRRGRWPEARSEDEVVVSEALASAQHLEPGDTLRALVNGRTLYLHICGIGLSPEHVYEVRPGDMFPDNRRFGVLWLRSNVLEQALGMRGTFNEAVLRLSRGVSEDEVIAAVDRALRPYGGLGAYGHARHVSARFISEELKQLEAMAFFVPSIFMAVAAFLLNIIVGRVVAIQREQIATLKALGYGNLRIGVHFVELSTLIVLLGAALGVLLGYAIGVSMTQMYAEYYRFATFRYAISGREIAASIALTLLASIAGTLGAVRRAVALRPAEAMRPASPATFRRSLLERLGLGRLLSTSGRMVLRNVSRRPLRALSSCVGIAMAVALLVTGLFFGDAMNVIIDNQFRRSQRQDVSVVFNRPVSMGVVHELRHFPGVLFVEPQRAVAATLRHGHRTYRAAISGLVREGRLQRVLSTSAQLLEVPEHGLMLSETLAKNIGVKVGDTVEVELLEGRRNAPSAVVTAIADEPFGTSAYASIDTANALAGTSPQVTSALLQIDERHRLELYRRLAELPTVAAVSSRKAMLASFDAMTEEVLLFFAFILSLAAGAMAMGVVYNAARISLSERERELATMRVIGLSRGEISVVLLGELFTLVLAALPLGCALGYGLAKATAVASSTEMYRVPLIVTPRTYVFAMAVVLFSSALVALTVRRRLDSLDLVSVLKTKE
ncbi:MAG: ABC transporter permease [Myxococcota bacterium]|nr:ABC transporter permease [Myxococcota bacterium]